MKTIDGLSEHSTQQVVFYTMLQNAFRDPDDAEPTPVQLEIDANTDLGEMLVDMLVSMKIFAEKLNPDVFAKEDLLGFTYIMNRLVVQSKYMNMDDLGCGEEDEEDEG